MNSVSRVVRQSFQPDMHHIYQPGKADLRRRDGHKRSFMLAAADMTLRSPADKNPVLIATGDLPLTLAFLPEATARAAWTYHMATSGQFGCFIVDHICTYRQLRIGPAVWRSDMTAYTHRRYAAPPHFTRVAQCAFTFRRLRKDCDSRQAK